MYVRHQRELATPKHYVYSLRMHTINRRAMLSALGVTAITPITGAIRGSDDSKPTLAPALVPPGGNRYAYAVDFAGKAAPCKVTSKDSGGAFSAFENVTPPKQGPPLHLRHREDEWFYVASSRFIFEIDGKRTEFGVGGSVFAPRGIPHRWANSGTDTGVLVVMLAPGGFEAFFDDVTQAVAKMGHVPHDELKEIYARHGVDLLGPKIFE
jgi:mannose-6-phosphate isomerase-like protein (cupin superfamily)